MINQAVPPGGDLCIALRQVEACDLPKRGRLGCAIFGSGGLRSRVPRTITKNFYLCRYNYYTCSSSILLECGMTSNCLCKKKHKRCLALTYIDSFAS